MPGIFRPFRLAAGRHKNDLRGDAPAIDLDGVRIDHTGAGIDHLDLGLDEQIDIDPTEARDLLVLVLDQLRPAEMRRRDGPAEAGSIRNLVMDMRCVNQQLLPGCSRG